MSNTSKRGLSLYIHIPFCISRCAYCDFNTFAGAEHQIPAYIKALQTEIALYSRELSGDFHIKTIYFGGGTPSIIPVNFITDVINSICSKFEIDENPEITFEMNPNGVSLNYLKDLSAAGINRLSIGMQSSHDDELRILGRQHTFEDVERCFCEARTAGYRNISLDIMFGFPTQSLASLKETVNQAAVLEPTHISIYGLTLHDGTRMKRQLSNGILPAIDEDLAGDMYAWLMHNLDAFGYDQYEISNWALGERYQSKHNLQYWINQDYLGIGAGAHSFVNNRRYRNINPIADYIENIQNPIPTDSLLHSAIMDMQHLDTSDIIKETMMMGLRLTDRGVNLAAFQDRFNVQVEDNYAKQIAKFISLGMIEYAGDGHERCIRLTRKGCMLGNQVFMAFI